MILALSDWGLVFTPFGCTLNDDVIGMLKQDVSVGEFSGGGPDGSLAGMVGVSINLPV